MRLFMTTTAVAAIAASAGFAQELSYANAGIGFTSGDFGGGNLSITEFDGAVEMTYQQFVFGADYTSESFDSDGFGPSDLTFSNYGAFAGYMPTSEILVGAGLTAVAIDFGGGTSDGSGYEVFGQYDNGQFAGGAFYSIPDSDDDDFSILAVVGEAEVAPGMKVGVVYETFSDSFGDESTTLLSGEYADGPIFARAAYVTFSEDDGGLFSARGAYDFGNAIHATASFETAGDDLLPDYTAYSVGGSYTIADGVSASASVGLISIADESNAVFSFELNYAMGESKRLDTAAANAAIDDRKNGFYSLVPFSPIGTVNGFFGSGAI